MLQKGMGTKRLETFSDLARHGVVLNVRCRSCQHQANVDPAAWGAKIRHNRSWKDIRFRCTKCNTRNAFVTGLLPEGRPLKPLG